MAKARYFCHQCNTIVHEDELPHPCADYKNDDVVYTVPQREDSDKMSTNREHAVNSNDDYGNVCETAEETRNTSKTLASPAHSVFSIENNKLSRNFADRPSSPEAPFHAPSRKGKMNSHAKQPLELEEVAGAVAGPSAVDTHSLGHGRERQYVCYVCHRQFKQKYNLVNHCRIHTGEKPFVCDFCGKDFNHKGSLNKHLLIHTGEKHFVCDFCGREFNLKGNLIRHLRKHTGERPYVCDICGRSFTYVRNLKTHVDAHNGKRYKCSVCGKTFSRNDYRNKHFREKHQ